MTESLEKVQVVGLGQACVDYAGRISAYPKEDHKAEMIDLHTGLGGPASTALVTLSRLGVSTSFLGSVSNDRFGQEIVRNLKQEKVDVSCLRITPGYTSQFAFISIANLIGKRTIFWHRGTVPHLTPNDVDMGHFPNARILHLDGLMIAASKAAAQQAKRLGMTTVLDAGTLRNGSLELVSLVDILIASETFAASLNSSHTSPEHTLPMLRDLGPGRVIITLGEQGSVGLDDQEIIRQKAFSVPVIDTTGAGDVYHGAYIYGMLQDWDMQQCMCFASAAAALKCKIIGAQKGIPALQSILGLIKEEEGLRTKGAQDFQ